LLLGCIKAAPVLRVNVVVVIIITPALLESQQSIKSLLKNVILPLEFFVLIPEAL
jgi:hypothetical protein